jgi:hypothetical protein
VQRGKDGRNRCRTGSAGEAAGAGQPAGTRGRAGTATAAKAPRHSDRGCSTPEWRSPSPVRSVIPTAVEESLSGPEEKQPPMPVISTEGVLRPSGEIPLRAGGEAAADACHSDRSGEIPFRLSRAGTSPASSTRTVSLDSATHENSDLCRKVMSALVREVGR